MKKVLIFFTLCVVPLVGLALNTVNTGWRASAVSTEIDAHSICKEVRTIDGQDYFVPTRSSAEWTTFISQHPSSIIVGDCNICSGTLIGGFCWYLGSAGQSCDQVCSSRGGVNLAGTRDYAGANGTDGQCWAVAQSLKPGVFNATMLRNIPLCDAASNYGWGCNIVTNSDAAYRCEYPTITSTSFMNVNRICACNS